MPRRLPLLVGAAALLAAGSAGAAADRAVVCGPPGARTLAADAVARVYSQHGGVYGCSRSGPRSYRLGAVANSPQEGRAGPVALAGADAAYGLTSYGVDAISAEVVVRRLTDGHVLRRHGAIVESAGVERFASVDAVVVKRDGSVAWIAHSTGIGPNSQTVTEVDKSDKSSPSKLLDNSPQIDRHSLRLMGSEITWRVGSSTAKAASLK